MPTLPDSTQVRPDIRDTIVSSSAEAGRRVEDARQRLRGGAGHIPAVATASGSAAEREPPPMTAESANALLERNGFPTEDARRLQLLLSGLAIIASWYVRDPTSRRRINQRPFVLAEESLARCNPPQGRRVITAVVALATALGVDLAAIRNPKSPIPGLNWAGMVDDLRRHYQWPEAWVPSTVVRARREEEERAARAEQECTRARARDIFDAMFASQEK